MATTASAQLPSVDIRKPSLRIDTSSRLPIYFAALSAYAALVLAAIYHHEPWADEAQSWLLARDSTLWDLWTRLLHYEGTPGLWQTFLHLLIRLGLPYSAFSYVPVAFGCAAAWAVMRYAPFPLIVRLLLPFTFFLGYQYVVIARSYDLLPILLFTTAILYPRAERHPASFATLLCFMAGISVHGVILSACIAISLGVFRWKTFCSLDRRRMVWAALVYISFASLVSFAAFPFPDVAFVSHPKFSIPNWFQYSTYTLREAFTGEGISALAVVAMTVPFLWRGRGLLFFVLSTFFLCTFGAVVYGAPWHQGIIVLSWLFALWISAGNVSHHIPRQLAWAAVAAVIAVHSYWTAASVAYDWKHSYSAGKEAADFIKASKIDTTHLYAAGYATTAIQPYFPTALSIGRPSYWDWSTHNRVNDASQFMGSTHRDYAIVGYKLETDRDHWSKLMSVVGYDPVRHFEGHLFWHAQPYEAESFDLYRRNPRKGNMPIVSSIPMNDDRYAGQLISGFYDIEANAWRWTARNFAVALKPPADSTRNGASIHLNLFFSDDQMKALGSVTLTADLDGRPLPSQTYTRPGLQEYVAQLPKDGLNRDMVCVDFHLDKSKPPVAGDARELGAVVTSVSIR